MLVFNNTLSEWIVDPHYLTILPFKDIWDRDKLKNKEIAKATLAWIYHMYNPRSPFKEYKKSIKSLEIVRAVFPKWFLDIKESELKDLIEKAAKIKEEQDAILEKEEREGKKAGRPKKLVMPSLKPYDPADDETLSEAINWYKQHLEQTPLWDAYNGYGDAMYNLTTIIRNPNSSAAEIRTASQELDTIPLKREKMRQQAEKDEAITLKVQGDKNIKRSEKYTVGKKDNVYTTKSTDATLI